MHRIERNVLEVGAVVARRLQAVQSKLRSNVLGGQLAAAHAGPPSLQQIERKKTHVGANLIRIDGSSGGARTRRQSGNLGNRIGRGLLGANKRHSRNACGHNSEN